MNCYRWGSDMSGDGQLRSDWNKALIDDVIAPAYSKLLVAATQLLGHGNQYFQLWPNQGRAEAWDGAVSAVYKSACRATVVYTELGSGRWIKPTDAILVPEGKISDQLAMVLLKGQLPVVRVPERILSRLQESGVPLQDVSPRYVRAWLSKAGLPSEYTWDDGLFLLEYCLSDLTEDTHIELVGLPLVPLSTKGFGTFAVEGKGGTQYFLSSAQESALLAKAAEALVSCDILDSGTSIERHLRSPHLHKVVNVKPLTEASFAKLLNSILPSSWKGRGCVIWSAAAPGHPSAAWLQQLWQYISSCEKLSGFSEWPLVVTIEDKRSRHPLDPKGKETDVSSRGILCRLHLSSHLILPDGCAPEVVSLLTSAGCRCLDAAFPWQHPKMWEVVHKSTIAGLLTALLGGCAGDVGRLHAELLKCSAEEVEAFRKHVGTRMVGSSREEVSENHIALLRRLPLFEAHSVEAAARTFVDLSEECFLAPPESDARLLTRKFLKLSSSEDSTLLRLLGVRNLSEAEFYQKHVFLNLPRLGMEVRDRTMLSVLQNLGRMCGQDANFSDILRDLAFVPAGGELKRPADLYDPTVPELRALLDSERHFPSGTFTAPAVLLALRGLGLRSSLDHEGVLDSAREVCRVAQLQSGEAATAVTRAKGLLHYINLHNHRLFGNDGGAEASDIGDDGDEESATGAPKGGDGGAEIDANEDFNGGVDEAEGNLSAPESWLKQLVGLPWLPVLLDPPEMHIPWTGNKHTRPGERLPGVMTLAAAGCVRPPADMWLVSFSQYMLDGEPCAKLSEAFGWNEAIEDPGEKEKVKEKERRRDIEGEKEREKEKERSRRVREKEKE
jgi:sacsin